VRGLDLGANDYVAKPFLRRELLARVRGQLRHAQESRDEQTLLDQELRAACDVQQRLLPQCQPIVPGLDYAGLCRPARGVSGDATVFYGVYDAATGTLTYANAGHYPPLWVRNSSCRYLDTLTAPIGLFPTLKPAECNIRLAAGDWLLVASDGIPEAFNANGEEFGETRLLALLDKAGQTSAAEFCQRAVQSACRFTDGPAADDMTLIAAHLLSAVSIPPSHAGRNAIA
jgi:serine phosphatase RsbU (regulator of sigma subunit)